MKVKIVLTILAIYDLLLFAGAMWFGILMLAGANGFDVFPDAWLGRLLIQSWLPVGILAVVVFGLGNLLAVAFTLQGNARRSAGWSASLGLMLVLGITVQSLLVGELVLPGAEFILFGLLQIGIAAFVLRSVTHVRDTAQAASR